MSDPDQSTIDVVRKATRELARKSAGHSGSRVVVACSSRSRIPATGVSIVTTSPVQFTALARSMMASAAPRPPGGRDAPMVEPSRSPPPSETRA